MKSRLAIGIGWRSFRVSVSCDWFSPKISVSMKLQKKSSSSTMEMTITSAITKPKTTTRTTITRLSRLLIDNFVIRYRLIWNLGFLNFQILNHFASQRLHNTERTMTLALDNSLVLTRQHWVWESTLLRRTFLSVYNSVSKHMWTHGGLSVSKLLVSFHDDRWKPR